MNYKEMALGMGICLNVLTDYQLNILQKAVAQETEEQERLNREKMIKEYTNKLDEFIQELNDHDLVLDYDFGEDEFLVREG